jgi:hypothetical protein
MGLQKIQPPALPVPPNEYDPQYLMQLIRIISIYFRQIASQAPIITNTANWSAVPTTTDIGFSDLPFNDMYRGATEDILRIKVDGIPYAATATQAYVDAGLALKVNKAGDTMTGNLTVPTLNATSVVIGSFTIQQTAGKLTFLVAGNPIGSLDTSGNFTVIGNVTGFGTP